MTQATPTEGQFQRSLGLLDATMIVAGVMIGSGIFIVSADVLRNVGSAGWLIAAWVVAGFMTVVGAVSYGELSGMYPRAGGQYVYLREAYNRLVAFLYGWAFFAVIQTGTIAAVGVAFAKFSAYLFPALSDRNVLWQATIAGTTFTLNAAQLVSIALVVALTAVNARGVNHGKFIQTTFTLAKIGALAGLIVFGLLLAADAETWRANWRDAFQMRALDGATITGLAVLPVLAVAMVGPLFSADAWNSVTFIAGEVKDPQRNVGLALFLGTALVCALYVLTNVMFTAALPLDAIAHAEADRVGVVAANAIFGATGTVIIAVLIMVSTFGCVNGLVLSGARVYYTMAQDGLFFRRVGTLNKAGVPAWGLWAQALWASVLCLSGRYGDLLDYVVFAVLVFYILTIAGIFVLRRRLPDAPRPYRAFGYPFLPALYIALALGICVALLVYKPAYTWPGLGIVLLGIPLYALLNRGARTLTAASA